MIKSTVLAFCLITQSALAQSRFTADSYLAEPEKNLGKTVSLCVDSVTVPAVNAVTKDPFRVLWSTHVVKIKNSMNRVE